LHQDKLRVYFTVDTETSMGGAWRNPAYGPVPLERTIFGSFQSKCYGIPLIMDILEQYGFRATFFTEVFCASLVGSDALARVFQTIRERGHDAQLHLHPVFRFFRDFRNGGPHREIDLMWKLPAEEQFQLIAEGVALFRDLTGTSPRVFRAGCYGASEVTLRALGACGIEIDSSYNLAYLGHTCGFTNQPPLNAPVLIEGIHEFPVTVFRVPGASRCKPLEISAVSVGEILTSMEYLYKSGCRDIVLVLHSFSLLKNTSNRYEGSTPDRIVIRRLRKLCAVLKEHEEIEVPVLGELKAPTYSQARPQLIPNVGCLRPVLRKVVQGVNRLPWL
jgi:hypothetical protein